MVPEYLVRREKQDHSLLFSQWRLPILKPEQCWVSSNCWRSCGARSKRGECGRPWTRPTPAIKFVLVHFLAKVEWRAWSLKRTLSGPSSPVSSVFCGLSNPKAQVRNAVGLIKGWILFAKWAIYAISKNLRIFVDWIEDINLMKGLRIFAPESNWVDMSSASSEGWLRCCWILRWRSKAYSLASFKPPLHMFSSSRTPSCLPTSAITSTRPIMPQSSLGLRPSSRGHSKAGPMKAHWVRTMLSWWIPSKPDNRALVSAPLWAPKTLFKEHLKSWVNVWLLDEASPERTKSFVPLSCMRECFQVPPAQKTPSRAQF